MLRFGRNLEADYGPNRIRPSLSGTSYFNADYLEDPFGFYVYVGAQGRAVAQNIFLDGNTFRDSRERRQGAFRRRPHRRCCPVLVEFNQARRRLHLSHPGIRRPGRSERNSPIST